MKHKNVSLLWSVLLHILFEIVENTATGMALINRVNVWPGGKPRADSRLNSFGDTLSLGAGWLLASTLDSVGTSRGWYEPHLAQVE